jgi:hypothetical protein
MPIPFCPGYAHEPFRSLVESYPDATLYPADAFRVEWGPIFHRGRLDGTARILVLGQDPAQHETIARRILMGTAGRRVQGFLDKLGMDSSYVMLNAFLYCVYGKGGAQHIGDADIAAYRNRWIGAILDASQIKAVVAFGTLADKAWKMWLASPDAAGRPVVAYRKLPHPTSPESAGGDVAAATAAMLEAYNAGLAALAPALASADTPGPIVPIVPYGSAFTLSDLPGIPQRDLPAGSPPWMGTTTGWAVRDGSTTIEKRFNIRVTAPVVED